LGRRVPPQSSPSQSSPQKPRQRDLERSRSVRPVDGNSNASSTSSKTASLRTRGPLTSIPVRETVYRPLRVGRTSRRQTRKLGPRRLTRRPTTQVTRRPRLPTLARRVRTQGQRRRQSIATATGVTPRPTRTMTPRSRKMRAKGQRARSRLRRRRRSSDCFRIGSSPSSGRSSQSSPRTHTRWSRTTSSRCWTRSSRTATSPRRVANSSVRGESPGIFGRNHYGLGL